MGVLHEMFAEAVPVAAYVITRGPDADGATVTVGMTTLDAPDEGDPEHPMSNASRLPMTTARALLTESTIDPSCTNKVALRRTSRDARRPAWPQDESNVLRFATKVLR